MAHVILFEHAGFHGQHKHVFGAEPNLNAADDNFFNDKVSSLVVLEGNWAFYADSNFHRQYPPILGPGLYPGLPAGIKNDDMSSLQAVNSAPTVRSEERRGGNVRSAQGNLHRYDKKGLSAETNITS